MSDSIIVVEIESKKERKTEKMAEEVWNKVPSVVLHEIYSILPTEDKIRASTTCRHWRQVFYQSVTWETLNLRVKSKDENSSNRALFFASCFSNKFRNINLDFDSMDSSCVEIVTEILEKISKNCHLRCFNLRPSHCLVEVSDHQLLEKHLVEPLLAVIRNSRSLKAFSLGGTEDLILFSPEILRLLALHHSRSLHCLGLASLKSTPHDYAISELDCKMLLPFRSLVDLRMDYDYVNDQLLQVLSSRDRVGLNKFSVIVHGIREDHPGTTDKSWSQFCLQNPKCSLHLSLLFSLEAVDLLCMGLLHPSMPLTHFKALFCEKISMEALHQLYTWYYPCLRSLWWVDVSSVNESDTLDQNSTVPHPLNMIAWRCRLLEELVVLGYDQLDENIIAIARLRGSQLKRLEFTEEHIFFDQFYCDQAGLHQLIEEVSSSLLRMWSPLTLDKLPVALSNCSTFDAAVEFAMRVVQESL